jgi:hypothetical protein
MRTAQTVLGLAAFERRGAGTDAERRAARWLQSELEGTGRQPVIEPFWCRPNWALAHAWHSLLGLAGSLVAVSSPTAGGGLILVALGSVIADALTGISLGRRLTPERASQNVVVPATGESEPASQNVVVPATGESEPGSQNVVVPKTGESEPGRPVRLVLTANYDAGRTGVAYWSRPRRAAARIRTITRGLTPGWQGWLAISLIWLDATAVARAAGSKGTAIGIAQLPPTVGLVIGLALLLDIASAEFSPAAGDNGTGVAVALALTRALDAAPPRRTAVELVLAGAGDGSAIGLRRYLRARRPTLTHSNTIVIGIAACGAGSPRWWASDGPLLPLPSFPKLRELCSGIAREDPGLQSRAHSGRGTSPAFPARLARLPTITLGCLDGRGLAPRSHQRADTAEAIDDQAADRAVEFGLLLVDAIDAFLASTAATARTAT